VPAARLPGAAQAGCSGGAAATIVFSHANGFPAGTYTRLFAAWRADGFAVRAIEKIGHEPRFPVSSNWPHLRDELVEFAGRERVGRLYLVGHSLGGYVSLLAASRRPDLASGVVLLDSPVLSGWKARAVHLAKATGLGERFTPGRISRRRRERWPSAEEAHAHFASKKAFARFAPGVLADYIASGVEPHESDVRLAFRREIETAIYNTLPHHLERLLRRHPLRCPLAFVSGSESAEARQVGLTATRRLTHGRMATIAGSHLFPLERPEETAATVLELIRAMA
jgi:pimeloyl-ACP methyl ester carboxylesterase